MKNNSKLRNVLRIAGNLLSLLAVIFVFKKLLDLGVDFTLLKKPSSLITYVLLCIVQCLLVYSMFYPWHLFLEILSGHDIERAQARMVAAKSQIYKYVPGNFFHIVVRDQITSHEEVGHFDANMATVLDGAAMIISQFVISFILLGRSIISYIVVHQQTLMAVVIVLAVLVVVLIILAVIFRNKIKAWWHSFTESITKPGNGVKLLKIVVYYLLFDMVLIISYLCCVRLVRH